ncbi:uncharacterized protein LOC128957087 [Oppia nitens]|uniref:uncharacterized protein LOC128957087 n=1 Tax=Oppia nitens TaxID=1686743 RepID=UPI0023DCE92E|nr:uncharacterized protein LOC128957087 [Oppia nitens]
MKIVGRDELTYDQLVQLTSYAYVACVEPIQVVKRRARQLASGQWKETNTTTIASNSRTSNDGQKQLQSSTTSAVKSSPTPTPPLPKQHKKRKRKFGFSTNSSSNKRRKRDDSYRRFVSEDRYFIEKIVDLRLATDGELMYLIKWRGYDNDSDNTWQQSDDLFDCQQHYRNYFDKLFTADTDAAITTTTTTTMSAPVVVMYTIHEFRKLMNCLSLTMSSKFDTAVLLRLNDMTVEVFDRNEKTTRKLRSNLEIYRLAMRRMYRKMRVNRCKPADNFWPQRLLIQHLVRELRIDKNFGSLEKLFEFVEDRYLARIELKEWADDINGQLASLGFTGDCISVENNADLEVPPKIKYLSEYMLNDNVSVDTSRLLIRGCCQCPGDCLTRKSCLCENKLQKNKNQFQTSYVLYECNASCLCNPQRCPNRRVQKGQIGRNLMIYKTTGRGWGVLTTKKIQRYDFVLQYLGRILDSQQTYYRYDDTYMFNIDEEFCGQTVFIDAKYYANISRFVNHSCEPNLSSHMTVLGNGEQIPRIAFFANRDIKPYEELTYDYNRITFSVDLNGIFANNNSSSTADEVASVDSGYTSSSGTTTTTSTTTTTTNNNTTTTSASHPPRHITAIDCMCGSAKCRKFI